MGRERGARAGSEGADWWAEELTPISQCREPLWVVERGVACHCIVPWENLCPVAAGSWRTGRAQGCILAKLPLLAALLNMILVRGLGKPRAHKLLEEDSLSKLGTGEASF